MRIGIFGGSFDPPHIAHLRLCEEAMENLKLDKILFIPVNIPPHKQKVYSSALHRLNMTKLSVKGNRNFVVSDIDIRRGGVSYTVDTLMELREKGKEMFLIIGEDMLNQFDKWKDYQKIYEMVKIAVLRREGGEKTQEKEKKIDIEYIKINNPLLNISSTMIRDLVKKNKSIRYLVTDKVEEYIKRHFLYK